jgi:hypothetical protein
VSITDVLNDFNLSVAAELLHSYEISVAESFYHVTLWKRLQQTPRYTARVFERVQQEGSSDPCKYCWIEEGGFPWVDEHDEETALRTTLDFLKQRHTS